VGLSHRDEVARAEIASDFDLVLDRPLRRPPERAGPQRLFFIRQLHLSAHTHETALVRT